MTHRRYRDRSMFLASADSKILRLAKENPR